MITGFFSNIEDKLNIKINFDDINISKNSPQKVKIENLTITINVNEPNQGSESKKSSNKLVLITSIVAIAFQLTGTFKNLTDLGFSEEQEKDVIECGVRFQKQVSVTDLYLNNGTDTCLNFKENSTNTVQSI